MRIVVIGGTGLIGSKLLNKLREHGHETVAAAPNTGVNTVTGEGLAEVLKRQSADPYTRRSQMASIKRRINV